MHRLLIALLVLPLALPAMAQDLDDLDSPSGGKKKSKSRTVSQRDLESEVVREIERGWYMRAGIGGNAWLLNYGQLGGYPMLSPGTTLTMGAGKDFVDQETQSISWGVDFQQGVYNGLNYSQQPSVNRPPTSFIEGDTRTYALLGHVEYSKYITRRFGVGVRGGAGVMFSPLLMEASAYDSDVVRDAWGGARPTVHDLPHPIAFGGPTFEYYTKLSHFSIGVDIDVGYAVGFDLGAGGQGYFKYTF